MVEGKGCIDLVCLHELCAVELRVTGHVEEEELVLRAEAQRFAEFHTQWNPGHRMVER